jgi:HEAT repeat protein
MTSSSHTRSARASAKAITKFVESKREALGIKNPRDAIKIALNRKNNSDFRERACFVLGHFKPPGSAQALLRLVRTEHDEGIGWEACMALGLIRDRRVTKPLLNLLKISTDPARRQMIAYALWGLADARARPVLIKLLSDKNEDETVRGFAAEGLGMLRPTVRSLGALVSALEDLSVNVRVSALCGLSAARYLVRANGSREKGRAARRFFNERAIPAIRARLHDRDAIKGEGTVASYAASVLSSWKGTKRG